MCEPAAIGPLSFDHHDWSVELDDSGGVLLDRLHLQQPAAHAAALKRPELASST